MVKHYNPSIVQDAQRILNTKMDTLSDNIADNIVPVIPVLPVTRFAETGSRSTSGAGNIQGAFTSKDYYITGINFAIVKDATCDVVDGTCGITVLVDGVSKTIASLPVLTLTAQSMVINVTLPFPLKVDRLGVIGFSSQIFTVGKFIRTATIYGYTQETTAS